MTRLFSADDAATTATREMAARERRDEVRRRAAEFDAELEKLGMQPTPAASSLASGVLGSGGVQPIRYESFRAPGSRWTIEHAVVGEDYVYQLLPKTPPNLEWNDVITLMIGMMDVIFPRSIEIVYRPPDTMFKLVFYTIRVKKIVGVPGWESACKERVLNGLATIDVW